MKIEPFYNKKEKKNQFRARFQLNNKEFTPKADTRKRLLELIDEIRAQEHRVRQNLEVIETPGPTLAELFKRVLPTIDKPHQRIFAERVFNNFLKLLPEGIRVKALKKSHFQIYIDWRSPMVGKVSKTPIKRETIYKELFAVTGALGKGELYWDELENWKKPELPKSSEKKQSRQESRRKRIVSRDNELEILLAELRKDKRSTQSHFQIKHRLRLADDLEFRYETGLRRKEVARLQPKNYVPGDEALRNVKRWKTNTTTKFFPLSKRAREILESRIAQMNGSKFIFTKDGEPVESDYRTLRLVCRDLDITYGRFKEDGFVPHDLRHGFASDIIEHADIETVRELLGHSNIGQTGDYLHTDEKKMRAAVRRREGIDIKRELVVIYKGVRRGKINAKAFVEKVRKLTDF